MYRMDGGDLQTVACRSHADIPVPPTQEPPLPFFGLHKATFPEWESRPCFCKVPG